ncbi:hypothetical protein Patl1_32202 [Pistacia atlantica]|uniref:Uncharacterized protein n=1 Tax=Pistacia atlantica TaxID=434234 RepID=A0ACC1AP20_9ROSI|nr:hypothetical protein Patl1_32202 [Pistacia atlantica]
MLSFPLLQVEVAQPLSKLCLEFPDLHIGNFFGVIANQEKGRSLFVLKARMKGELNQPIESLGKKFRPGTFSEVA